MIFDIVNRHDSIAVINAFGPLTSTTSVAPLAGIMLKLKKQGKRAFILDCGRISCTNFSGLTSLVEIATRTFGMPVAFCNLPDNLKSKLGTVGLEHIVKAYENVDDVLTDTKFRAFQLRNLRTIVLCAGQGSRVKPITNIVPKPMLDVVGKPVLVHILDHLESFGIRDIFLNPGHLGPQIHNYFSQHPRAAQSVFYLNEGRLLNNNWHADPIGSASTVKKLQTDHNSFCSDFLVICGDALIDIDIAQMLAQHVRNDADVTIAALNVSQNEISKYGIIDVDPSGRILNFQEKPIPGSTQSTLANTGIYIFNPRVLGLIPDTEGLDIATDLLSKILSSGGKMQVFSDKFSWTDIGCGKDYFGAIQRVLNGDIPNTLPAGAQRTPGQWIDETAKVSRRAKISGPVYVGPYVTIAPGVTINGPVSIGAGAVVDRGAFLRQSLIMPETHVKKGAVIDGQITHAEWSVSIQHADGSSKSSPSLEFVTHVGDGKPGKIAVQEKFHDGSAKEAYQ
ncbi:MAG: sugar phosphate nucleotidyltransferase [Paracoccaceae bacterium]